MKGMLEYERLYDRLQSLYSEQDKRESLLDKLRDEMLKVLEKEPARGSKYTSSFKVQRYLKELMKLQIEIAVAEREINDFEERVVVVEKEMKHCSFVYGKLKNGSINREKKKNRKGYWKQTKRVDTFTFLNREYNLIKQEFIYVATSFSNEDREKRKTKIRNLGGRIEG